MIILNSKLTFRDALSLQNQMQSENPNEWETIGYATPVSNAPESETKIPYQKRFQNDTPIPKAGKTGFQKRWSQNRKVLINKKESHKETTTLDEFTKMLNCKNKESIIKHFFFFPKYIQGLILRVFNNKFKNAKSQNFLPPKLFTRKILNQQIFLSFSQDSFEPTDRE